MSKGTVKELLLTAAMFAPIPGLQQAAWYTKFGVSLGRTILAYSYFRSKVPRSGALEGQAGGQTLNIMSNEAPIPVVYGRPTVGGR